MKTRFLILLLSAALILTACATPAGAATTATQNGITPTPGILSESYPNALPINSQLAMGTIKLKDSPEAVTAEQAAKLLPLWQALQMLSTKTTASPIEVSALVAQIQETMSANQLQTIAGYKLTQADTMAVLQSLGGANGFAGRGGNSGTPSARSPGVGGNNNNNRGGQGGNFAPPPDGGGPGGGPGGIPGAGGGGGQATISPSIQATARAQAGGQRTQIGNTIFFNAVVVYLEQLAPK